MASGVQAGDKCVNIFNELKLEHKHKYIVYALSKDFKEIVVEASQSEAAGKSNEDLYDEFTKKLPLKEPRYGVFDFEHEKEDGSGKRNRIVFVNWAPDESPVRQKMIYSSSKDALRRGLVGIHVDVQATDESEASYDTVFEKCNKLR